jgi:hypothetical protein
MAKFYMKEATFEPTGRALSLGRQPLNETSRCDGSGLTPQTTSQQHRLGYACLFVPLPPYPEDDDCAVLALASFKRAVDVVGYQDGVHVPAQRLGAGGRGVDRRRSMSI